MSKLVSDCHSDLSSGEFDDTQAYSLINEVVVAEFCSVNETSFTPWVGPHKNVHYWVITESRHAIGFNENPATGWSFPTIKLGKARFEKLTNRFKSSS